MDLVSHTLTGLAVGSIIANFSTDHWKQKIVIIFLGGLGGALPDLDAISLWSKFDVTFGKLFQLSHSGKEIYFGKFWYSHHGMLHSIFAIVLLFLIFILTNIFFAKKKNTIRYIQKNKFKILAFGFGFLFHLLEDMPTPASVWGGVPLFFPSKNYIGGFGKIWWWNNYDLFLIIFSVFFLTLLLNLIPNSFRKLKSKTAITIFSIGFFLFLFQLNTRPFDFSYTGHTQKYAEYEVKSKEIQKQILGEKLYKVMAWLDSKIPLYF